MTGRRHNGRLLPGLLLVVCLGLAWLIYSGLRTTPQMPQLEGKTVEVAPLAALPNEAEFTMPPPEAFAEIVQRPIFSPTRRPPADGGIAPASVATGLNLNLIGVVISPEEEIAIVTPSDGSTFVRLSKGDRFQGWTVRLIEPDRVTFQRDQDVEQIRLSYDEPPPKPPAIKRPVRQQSQDTRARQPEQPEQERE